MLVNLTIVVNFTNTLYAVFCIQVFFKDFFHLQFGFVVFFGMQKEISAKGTYKMLMKLALRVNLTKLLQALFCMKVFFEALMHSGEYRRLDKRSAKRFLESKGVLNPFFEVGTNVNNILVIGINVASAHIGPGVWGIDIEVITDLD